MSPLSATDWSRVWESHLAEYLAVPARTGMHLEWLFGDRQWKFLELAGGSLRGANYLSQRGYDSTGSDYLPEIISKARKAHDNPLLKTRVVDGCNASLPDEAFDVPIHYKFLFYFSQDASIEQMRI